MIELAILGLLDEQEVHGYELRKRLADLLGARLSVSFGSLYPALGRLERAGLVKTVTGVPSPPPVSPMSGSLVGELAAFRAQRRSPASGRARGGRGRKVYGITDSGRQRLHDLLVDPDIADERDFAVRVAFCRLLTSAERLALFERRRADLLARRDERRRAAAAAGPVNRYLRSLLERDTDAFNADLAWLDRLIADERHSSGSDSHTQTPLAPATGASSETGGSR